MMVNPAVAKASQKPVCWLALSGCNLAGARALLSGSTRTSPLNSRRMLIAVRLEEHYMFLLELRLQARPSKAQTLRHDAVVGHLDALPKRTPIEVGRDHHAEPQGRCNGIASNSSLLYIDKEPTLCFDQNS